MSVSRIVWGRVVYATGPGSTWDLADDLQFVAALAEDAEEEMEFIKREELVESCPNSAAHYMCTSPVEDADIEALVMLERCSCGAVRRAVR